MKRFVAFLLVATSAGAAELPWRLKYEKRKPTVAVSEEIPGLKIELRRDLGGVKLLEWRDAPTNSNIGVLIYTSGTAGTSAFYRIDRAVIVDKVKRKTIADEVWHVEPLSNAKPAPQPKWQWSPTGVVVTSDGETERYSW